MKLTTALLIALALSVDAFFAGVTFGLKRVRVPITSALIVGGTSGLIVYTALLAGHRLAELLPPQLAPWLGAGLLIAIGLWVLTRQPQTKNPGPASPWPDFDRSGHISPWEAVWLGGALAIDAFGTGLGISLSGGHGPTLPVAAALVTLMAILLGSLLGSRVARRTPARLAHYLPGAILILLGLSRLLALA